MYLSETAAREMLFAVGLRSAKENSVRKLAEQLNSIVTYQDDLEIPQDKALKTLYKKCLETIRDGDRIEIGEPPAKAAPASETNGHGKADAKTAPKAKPKARPAAASRVRTVNRPGIGRGKARKMSVEAGKVIVREFKGRPYKVKVLPDGTFLYDDAKYSSLTNVAKKITGYPSVSGPLFFGLVKRKCT